MGDGAPTKAGRSYGAVTFLDVLGWKGIWGRESDAIGSLQSLIKSIERRSQELGRGRGRTGFKTQVISISDTIVIITPAVEADAIEALVLHGQLCANVLPDSILKGIPIRGACAYGHFEVSSSGSIFLGSAIDEAASWHENTDWIGVSMTPSARFIFGEDEREPWCMYNPPFKQDLEFKTFAVKWNPNYDESSSISEKFIRMGPIYPDLINKFTNTIKFIKEYCDKEK